MSSVNVTRLRKGGQQTSLNEEALRTLRRTRTNEVVSGVFEVLYSGILFSKMTINKSDTMKVSHLMTNVIKSYWVPLAMQTIDALLVYGFVVIGIKTVDVQVDPAIRQRYPNSTNDKIKVQVPYVVDVSFVNMSYTVQNGEVILHAELRDDAKFKLFVFQELNPVTFDVENQRVMSRVMRLNETWESFVVFEQHLMTQVGNVVNQVTFVQNQTPLPEDAQNLLATASLFPTEMMRETEVAQQEAKLHLLRQMDSQRAFDLTARGFVVDPADNIRILPNGVNLIQRQAAGALPISDVETFRNRLTEIAASMLDVPVSFATFRSKSNTTASSSAEDRARLFHSRVKVTESFQDIAQVLWRYLYDENSNVEVDIPIVPIVDTDLLKMLVETESITRSELVDAVYYSSGLRLGESNQKTNGTLQVDDIVTKRQKLQQ